MAYKGIKLIPNSLQIEINLASLLSEHQFLQEEKLRTYAEIEELETKIEQLESDKERLREIAVGLADKLWELEWDMTRSSAMSQKANRRKWGTK
ncbi:TPA: hypothetical protein ACIRGN_000875 [Streptococcus suis]|uniref:Uncharacterized protein n=1 Tax=Streptococcus suis TaxID=1307 RepID=A0A116MJV1_STRSU|nr:hypothetical protein [Streptococcus suis]QBX21648.1 hypothetical protein Javan585_0022 [Streptococcus phage Javan585]MDN2981771.1 hypothetical protein [Streptococcus suis]MDW8574877.1 hypothetical protein [Streptococcus suis]MDW8588459.1 hypothetical protein [Streptococcus suis]MDW8614792.1 hypothetical protein [Streptococcus suis]